MHASLLLLLPMLLVAVDIEGKAALKSSAKSSGKVWGLLEASHTHLHAISSTTEIIIIIERQGALLPRVGGLQEVQWGRAKSIQKDVRSCLSCCLSCSIFPLKINLHFIYFFVFCHEYVFSLKTPPTNCVRRRSMWSLVVWVSSWAHSDCFYQGHWCLVSIRIWGLWPEGLFEVLRPLCHICRTQKWYARGMSIYFSPNWTLIHDFRGLQTPAWHLSTPTNLTRLLRCTRMHWNCFRESGTTRPRYMSLWQAIFATLQLLPSSMESETDRLHLIFFSSEKRLIFFVRPLDMNYPPKSTKKSWPWSCLLRSYRNTMSTLATFTFALQNSTKYVFTNIFLLQEKLKMFNEATETYEQGLNLLPKKPNVKLLNEMCKLNLQAVRDQISTLFSMISEWFKYVDVTDSIWPSRRHLRGQGRWISRG